MASSSSSPPMTPCSAFSPSSPTIPFYRRPFLDSYYAAPQLFTATSDYSPIGEEEDSQDASYYFAPESHRSTFFVVSAERGRWKTDPMPHKFHSKPRICEHRPLSSWEKELETPVSDSADTLPALDTDRDSSFGPTPSSPLPPSSPPLSPISHASSPLPFSSPLSSPLSSPISEMLSLGEDVQDAMAPNQNMELLERSDLNSKEILDPLPKPMLDVIVKAVLGPRENRVDETQLGSGSRGVKRKLGDGKKRKEDNPGPESSRKKRRIEGGKKRANPKEVGQPSAKEPALSKPAEDPPPSSIKAEDPCPSASFIGASSAELRQDAQDGEILGMLIESMAASRASSLPVSFLYKSVMQSRPALKAQKSDEEWFTVFLRVLESGIAGRGSGIFGKVDSSGKDDRDRPLESRWFYVPEMDEDQERAGLIKSMMPRPAKRNETKKYKQYYYRPLDKISRWDPEDSL